MALWLEQGDLRYATLTPNLKAEASATGISGYIRIRDVGAGHLGQVVLVRRNGLGVVVKVEGDLSVRTLWEFEDPVR